jgi:ABC-2 type transport system ATP-binding protein
VVEFEVVQRDRLPEVVDSVATLSDAAPGVDDNTGRVSIRVGDRGSQSIVDVVRRLDALGVRSEGLALRRPSLDDVFLSLTGHGTEEESLSSGGTRGTGRRAK